MIQKEKHRVQTSSEWAEQETDVIHGPPFVKYLTNEIDVRFISIDSEIEMIRRFESHHAKTNFTVKNLKWGKMCFNPI